MQCQATSAKGSRQHLTAIRSQPLVLAALLLFCSASVTARGIPPADRQDGGNVNILVILMDDLGWRDLGCYGGRFIETPIADRLAGQGMRFTDAYAAAPVCSPTRASLLTGQYPGRIGMYEVIQLRDRPYARLTSPPLERELPESLQTAAEILSRRGYVCGSVGKWHIGRTPVEEGFVEIAGRLDDPELAALAAHSPQKQIGKVTAQALRFLRAHRDRPFLLFLNHHAVHAPLEARPELIEKYRAKAAEVGVTDVHPTYAAMTEMGDQSLGQVLAELDRLGLADETVVIFTSDNGGLIEDLHLKPPTPLATSNLPLRSQKGDLYEGGIRIPLIVRWPGKIAPNSVCRVPVTSPDLFATILDIAGAAAPAGQSIDGISLVPLLCRTGGIERDRLFWHFPTSMWSRWPGGAIRKGNFKLIEFYEDDRVELYDLASDIGETNNLAAQRPDLVRDLRGELQQWRQSVGARMPVPNPDFDPDRADLLPDTPMIPAANARPAVRPGTAAAHRPNIILIFADDLGYGDVGCYGGMLVPTPAIDSLARDGVRCTDGYVTAPVCAPSRFGLLTGAYQQRFAMQWNEDQHRNVRPGLRLPDSHRTLPEALRAAGYVTGHLGKWNFVRDVNTCVDEARDVMDWEGDYFPGPDGRYVGVDDPKKPDSGKVHGIWGPQRPGEEYLTDRIGRHAVEFIEKHKARPFFLYLAFNAVHSPWHAKAADRARFAHLKSPPLDLYASMIATMDENVGRVLAKLTELGLEENTLVVFASDNGPAMGSARIKGWPEGWPEKVLVGSAGPLNGYKGQYLEGGIREPFIFRWPARLKAGVQYRQPVSTMDLYATFLAAAAAPVPEGTRLDGVNLLPYLASQRSDAPHESLFWKHGTEGAVRQGDWKLLVSGRDPRLRLFNLAEDLGETRDLSSEKPELTQRLHRAWLDWSATLPPRAADQQAGKAERQQR